ncbi:GTP cyclohydrolase 1 feedback regulatory protein-like isoform X2 [Oratosquilla oratoria]|uniref:GTP cyclohydrolase 1 feedback regulatory protein-like isoform X2 n=1 Tax=Oratosquilla oratoria TaxID=337810 RepID=UPI003F7748F4
MPYMMISTLIRLETGPTYVGDAKSDPVLMNHLEATLTKEPGQILLCCGGDVPCCIASDVSSVAGNRDDPSSMKS